VYDVFIPGGIMEIKLIGSLERLLANVFNEYLHAHGFHWNVVGPDFAQLHKFFQKIYEDVYESIDPIAENLRKLNVSAPFHLSQFTELKDTPELNSENAMGMIGALYSLNANVIANLNEVFELANTLDEQGICNFIAGRIEMHQKWAWQLRSFKA
jgi:starvation-inducible DNA-binding protein